MKAWLFLTDVARDEGPLTYIPGSHRLTPARLAWEKQKSLIGASPCTLPGELTRVRVDSGPEDAARGGEPTRLHAGEPSRGRPEG